MRYLKRNTLNLISMIASIFSLFAVLVAIPGGYGNVLISYCIVLSIFLIFMPLLNALLQNMTTKMVYDPQKYFFTLKFNESAGYEWVVCLSAMVLLFFIPNTDLRVLGMGTVLLTIAAWMAVTILTIWASRQFTRVEFLTDTILVRGLNFFKAAGLSQKTTTGLGVYTYEEFDGFRLKEEKLILMLLDGKGQISVVLPKDKAPQVTSYLTAKGVLRKEK